MNDAREIVPGVSRPPRREDYIPIVQGLRPFIEGEELMLRSSMLLMRDRAMATKGASRTSEPSWAILDVVERICSECAMNHNLHLEQLRELRRLCGSCVATARDFDMLFQPSLPGIDDGEADAPRG